MTIENPQGIAPLPSERDRAEVDSLTKVGLGDQATGRFIGAMAKGQHGDAAFYGHAIVIEDPSVANHARDWEEYLEKVGETARSIDNTSPVAGNVVLDITLMSEITTTSTSELVVIVSESVRLAEQLAEIIKNADMGADERAEALTKTLRDFRVDDWPGLVIDAAMQLARDRRSDVRLYALEMLRPFSGYVAEADAIIWGRLLQDKTSKVMVATYEMLREHAQNATFKDLSGARERRTFPGRRAVDMTVMMSAAIPRYEYATRNRKN